MKKKEISFSGFSENLVRFFEKLEKNNNKDWFHENKKEYENIIREPAKLLVNKMSDIFAEENLPFISDVKKSMFRINRDIRFSKNKDPYKTNIGLFFPYTLNQTIEKAPASVGLYFHIEPKETFVAGGLKCPETAKLNLIRDRIADEYELLEKILNNKTFRKEFPIILTGESLKRIPRGFPKDHPREDWLRLKEYIVWSTIKHEDTYTEDIAKLLLRKAKTIIPFLDFLNEPLMQ